MSKKILFIAKSIVFTFFVTINLLQTAVVSANPSYLHYLNPLHWGILLFSTLNSVHFSETKLNDISSSFEKLLIKDFSYNSAINWKFDTDKSDKDKRVYKYKLKIANREIFKIEVELSLLTKTLCFNINKEKQYTTHFENIEDLEKDKKFLKLKIFLNETIDILKKLKFLESTGKFYSYVTKIKANKTCKVLVLSPKEGFTLILLGAYGKEYTLKKIEYMLNKTIVSIKNEEKLLLLDTHYENEIQHKFNFNLEILNIIYEALENTKEEQTNNLYLVLNNDFNSVLEKR